MNASHALKLALAWPTGPGASRTRWLECGHHAGWQQERPSTSPSCGLISEVAGEQQPVTGCSDVLWSKAHGFQILSPNGYEPITREVHIYIYIYIDIYVYGLLLPRNRLFIEQGVWPSEESRADRPYWIAIPCWNTFKHGPPCLWGPLQCWRVRKWTKTKGWANYSKVIRAFKRLLKKKK